MNACCEKAIESEWEEIHKFKPFLHFCPDWDYMLIDKGQEEFENCFCFDDNQIDDQDFDDDKI